MVKKLSLVTIQIIRVLEFWAITRDIPDHDWYSLTSKQLFSVGLGQRDREPVLLPLVPINTATAAWEVTFYDLLAGTSP